MAGCHESTMADTDDEATDRFIYQLVAGDLDGRQDGGNDVQVGAVSSNEDDEINGLGHQDQQDDDNGDEADHAGVALDWNFQPVQPEHEAAVSTQSIEEDHDLYCADGEENGRYDAENQTGEGEESSKSNITGLAEGQGSTATDEWDAPHPQYITTNPSYYSSVPLDPWQSKSMASPQHNIDGGAHGEDSFNNELPGRRNSKPGTPKGKGRAGGFPKPFSFRRDPYSDMPGLIRGTSNIPATARRSLHKARGFATGVDNDPEEDYSIEDLRAQGYQIIPLSGEPSDRDGYRIERRRPTQVVAEIRVGKKETLTSILKAIREKNGERF